MSYGVVPLGFGSSFPGVVLKNNFRMSFPPIMNQGLSLIDHLAYNLSSSLPINISLFVKLDDHIYMIWKDQLMIFVTSYGLEGILDGSLSPPSRFLGNSITPNSSYRLGLIPLSRYGFMGQFQNLC